MTTMAAVSTSHLPLPQTHLSTSTPRRHTRRLLVTTGSASAQLHDAAVPMRVVVIGAGCFGLSSAIRLLHAGYSNVTIIAREKTPNTTTDGAGALWRSVDDG